MTSEKSKERSNRFKRNGCYYANKDSTMVLSIDPYNTTATKYGMKSDNYQASRNIKVSQ